jgi:hypothetical protein
MRERSLSYLVRAFVTERTSSTALTAMSSFPSLFLDRAGAKREQQEAKVLAEATGIPVVNGVAMERSGKKTHAFAPFILQMTILSRQARDTHTENSKRDAFSYSGDQGGDNHAAPRRARGARAAAGGAAR